MNILEFSNQIRNFSSLGHQDKILHFMWFLHVHGGKEFISASDLKCCYQKRSESNENLTRDLTRLLDKRPRVILRTSDGFFLENKTRSQFNEKYGSHETTIALSAMLRDLPGKVSSKAERLFLSEAISCYHHKSFRAAIVMAWNLAYDHLLRWILSDALRLNSFNGEIANRVGIKRGSIVIAKREDFEALGEQEVLDICNRAKLFQSSNTKKLLDIQLVKRNLAAHPSLLAIDGPQADDTISSLVNNVVLELR